MDNLFSQESQLRTKFEQREAQITMRELYENFGIILVHSLPDDSEEQMQNDRLKDFTSNKTLEVALNRCLAAPIENLCFSSVKKDDDYNRWFGRYYGLMALDGEIVSASKNDAHSWHSEVGHHAELATNKAILVAIQEKFRNEINIRTKPDQLLLFFDLDYALQNLKWGATTINFGTGRSVYDEFSRFKTLAIEKGFPCLALYKGKIVEFDPEMIAKEIENFEPIDDTNFQEQWQKLALLRIKLNNILSSISFEEMLEIANTKQP